MDPASGAQKDDQLRNDPKQEDRSKKAQEKFDEALQKDDAAMTAVIPETGAVPHFSPARPGGPNGEPDYNWYHHHHPGIENMKTTLESSSHHPAVIAMLSCDSKAHFEKKLQSAAPDSALLMTNMVSTIESIEKAQAGLIDGLLGERCDDDFVASMSAQLPLVEDHPESGMAPSIDFLGWGVKTPNVMPAPFRKPSK